MAEDGQCCHVAQTGQPGWGGFGVLPVYSVHQSLMDSSWIFANKPWLVVLFYDGYIYS